MNAAQRGQRRHDLLLASALLRREIDANLRKPRARRRARVALGRHRRAPAPAPRGARGASQCCWALRALAMGGTAIGRAALRHLGWLSNLWLAWQLWKQWQR